MNETREHLVDAELVFKAMADATRRRILQIAARSEMSVSELVECLALPQSTVSRHLKVLREAGLIYDRREGTAVWYSAPNGENGINGDSTPLQGRLLDWIGHEDLPRSLDERVNRVLNRRRDNNESFFSRVAHRWDQMRLDAFGDAFHLEALTALLPHDWVVADIGAGTGYLLPVLAGCFRKVIAVDPVQEMLDVARSRCAVRKITNVAFKRGDLSRLPINDERVDMACAVLVLHHVPAPADALSELHRVIRPGGSLLIVEQKEHDLDEFHERMQDRWRGFAPQSFARDVAAAGFDNVRCRNIVTDARTSGSVEAPELFILTARRKPELKQTRRKQPSKD